MGRDKENFATELLSGMKRRLNIWRVAAIVGIALNIIQWVF